MSSTAVAELFAPLEPEQGLHLLDVLTWFPSNGSDRWEAVAQYVGRNADAYTAPSAATCQAVAERILQATQTFEPEPDGAGRWRDIPRAKWLYQVKYDLMNVLYPDEWFVFMNMGHADGPEPAAGAIWEDAANLYRLVAGQVDLTGRQVLEVGSGRGGGAALVAAENRPSELIGVDYSPANVEFCQRRHKAPNLRFTVGDAEALPFPDASFDAVLNIESAHCYPDIDRFFAEVVRVLRPGGHLLFADEWWTQQLPELLDRIRRPGLRILAEQDLTPGVIEALRRLKVRAEVLLAELPEGPRRLQYERFFMERVCRESATSYTSGRFVFHGVLAVRDQT